MSIKRKLLLAVSFVVMIYALANLMEMFLSEKRERQKIEELVQVRQASPVETMADEGELLPLILSSDDEANVPKMLPELEPLYQRNADIAGWMKIDGTRIDYPVMQNLEDASFYLNHDFDKDENSGGLPFLDANSRTAGAGILLIHGHHMKNGWMFKDLIKYKQEAFYKAHSTIHFSTLYEQQAYEIIAVILSQVFRKSDDVFKYYQIEHINTPDAFETYVDNVKQLALYDTGVTAEYGDRLIVLSTCEYSNENGRLAVIARKLNESM